MTKKTLKAAIEALEKTLDVVESFYIDRETRDGQGAERFLAEMAPQLKVLEDLRGQL